MADKTVIVTGASQGIGAGLANRFLEGVTTLSRPRGG